MDKKVIGILGGMEFGEALPAAEEASRIRGSGTIVTTNGSENRNAATVRETQ